MKRILIIFLAASMLCNCTFNFTPSSDNPSETPSTNPDNTPSTDKPSTNIPNIPGAPAINTDENYIVNYRSQTLDNVYGYLGVTVDALTITMTYLEEFSGYWWSKYQTELISPFITDTVEDSVKLDSNASIDFVRGAKSNGNPYIDFTIVIPGLQINYTDITVWGTSKSEYVGIIDKNEETGDISINTSFRNCNISFIIEILGNRFSFMTENLNMTQTRLYGTVYINGIRYDIDSPLPSN